MTDEYVLDKTFDTGDTYTTTERDYFVFRKVGYDEAAKKSLKVDGKKCLEVHQNLSPLAYNPSGNIFGLIDLRDLFIVVPPETSFELTGSGQLLRCKGVHGQLDPQEDMPGRYETRFKNQSNHYWKVKSFTTTQNIASDDEWSVGDITPKTREEYKFNHRAVKVDGGGQLGGWDQAWIRFYVDNNPMIAYAPDKDQWGWDMFSFPDNSAVAENGKPQFMKDREQVLEGDVKWELRIKGSTDVAVGASASVGMRFFAEYKSPSLY